MQALRIDQGNTTISDHARQQGQAFIKSHHSLSPPSPVQVLLLQRVSELAL
jgi:hypothetical protein